jgi:hypothetical protein
MRREEDVGSGRERFDGDRPASKVLRQVGKLAVPQSTLQVCTTRSGQPLELTAPHFSSTDIGLHNSKEYPIS